MKPAYMGKWALDCNVLLQLPTIVGSRIVFGGIPIQGNKEVIVAADDQRILEAVQGFGGI